MSPQEFSAQPRVDPLAPDSNNFEFPIPKEAN